MGGGQIINIIVPSSSMDPIHQLLIIAQTSILLMDTILINNFISKTIVESHHE